jgi:hypothetical protein
LPATSAPPSTGGSSGNVYSGALPSTTDRDSTYGGSTGSDGSLYGNGGSSLGGSNSSSGSGSLLGPPSSVIPSTSPSSSSPSTGSTSGGSTFSPPPVSPSRGGLPYEERSSSESDDPDSEAPAIGSRTGDAVVMNGIETKGYALVSPTAHHYIFGNLAVADYIDRGQRRIVTMEQETDLPKADPNFLYYREIRDGNRWAFATKAGPDRRYAVYYQSPGATADGKPKWRRMQRAELQWSRRTPSFTESVVFE